MAGGEGAEAVAIVGGADGVRGEAVDRSVGRAGAGLAPVDEVWTGTADADLDDGGGGDCESVCEYKAKEGIVGVPDGLVRHERDDEQDDGRDNDGDEAEKPHGNALGRGKRVLDRRVGERKLTVKAIDLVDDGE